MYDLEVRIASSQRLLGVKASVLAVSPASVICQPGRDLFIRLKIEVDFRSSRNG